ncbi:hypothetical protein [Nonomuraea jabiensis]
MPSGGHVEPGEELWETVERECREVLDEPAGRLDPHTHRFTAKLIDALRC